MLYGGIFQSINCLKVVALPLKYLPSPGQVLCNEVINVGVFWKCFPEGICVSNMDPVRCLDQKMSLSLRLAKIQTDKQEGRSSNLLTKRQRNSQSYTQSDTGTMPLLLVS